MENAKLLKEIFIETKNEEITGTFSEAKLRQHKTEQQEKKKVISMNIRYMLPNRKSKKDGNEKTSVIDYLIYLEDQLSPYLNQISFCIFQG